MPVKIQELVAVVNMRARGFQQGVNQVVSGANRMSGSFIASAKKIALRASIITAGVAAVGVGALAAARKFANAAEQQIDATRKLEAVFKATGNAAGLTVQQVEKFAAARQSVTNFGDEVTLQGAAVLATFKNIREEAFFRTLTAAQDVSALLGGDLQSSVLQLGKALNDPVTGLTMLNRVGISFTKTQQETIKGLVEQGRLFEAQGMILAEVESQFGGTAEAVSRPWQRFQNLLSDIAENIGMAVVPMFDALGGILSELMGSVAGNADGFKAIGESVAAFFRAHRQDILDALRDGLAWISDAAKQAWERFQILWPVLVQLWSAIKPLLSVLFDLQSLLLKGLATGFRALSPITGVAAKAISVVAGAISAVIEKAKELLGLSDEALLKAIEQGEKIEKRLTKSIQSKSTEHLKKLLAVTKDLELRGRIEAELERRAQAAQQSSPAAPGPAGAGGGMPAAGSSAPAQDFAAAVAEELKRREQAAFGDKVNAEADRITGADVAAQQDEIRQAFEAAVPATIEFGAHLDSLRDKLPREQLDQFANAAVGMTNAVRDGRMTSDAFSDAMNNLRAATDSAVEAAEQKAAQERREALLRGDFAGAGLDLQAAAQDKIAQHRMRLFDEQAQQLANRMLGLNGVTEAVNNGMQRLTGGVNRVTGAFENAARRVQQIADPRQAQEALNQFGAFMSTQAGKIALLRARIATESQPLQLRNLSGDRRREITAKLEDLQRQLNSLLTAPPPLTMGLSGDPMFKDPGLQGGGVQITNNLTFPNLTRLTNSDARHLLDALQQDMHRRGAPMAR